MGQARTGEMAALISFCGRTDGMSVVVFARRMTLEPGNA